MGVRVCPPDHRHAATTTCVTAHGCSCDACHEAHRDYMLYWRQMTAAGRSHVFDQVIDATGTNRRLQALMCLGWSQSEIARRYTVTQELISDLTIKPRVRASSAALAARIFEDLSASIPPTSTTAERMSVNRTRALARRRGWIPPLGWDDIDRDQAPAEAEPDPELVDVVKVDLTVAGQRPSPLTIPERHQVVRVLNAHGHTDSIIALACGVTPETIARDRHQLGIRAAPSPHTTNRRTETAA